MKKQTNKITSKPKRKLDSAKEDFEKMQREIKLFIKDKEVKIYTTSGKWQTNTSPYASIVDIDADVSEKHQKRYVGTS